MDFESYGSSIGVWNKAYYIPLCLNRTFRNLYRGAAQNTPTSNSENFSSCSLMDWTEGSPTGFGTDFESWIAEKCHWQKWSISYLWEHFLVPEHRIPIWLGFILRISMEFLIFHYKYAIIWILQIQRTMEFESCDSCTRTEPILQTQPILELQSCDTCTRTEPIWIHELSMASRNS